MKGDFAGSREAEFTLMGAERSALGLADDL